ncbi:glycosyltransferase [Roseomonas sp. NAR14]|uniref:Glycosyltransferase n=1 Tax=Roseomonas acroporae TaxID=2937791 RepID=A0A9X1YAC3_9PROT|nr:glycosyltransferase [Roseomonas acroporae]
MTQALLAAWLLVSLLATLGTALYLWRVRRPLAPAPAAGRVALIVPVRGAGPGLDAFLRGALAQRGVPYRLILAVESESDPAAAAIDAATRAAPVPVRRVTAGPAAGRGQKVHNLLAALPVLEPADAFVVFADADTAPPPDWLAQLLRPVLLGRAEAASGYFWTLPADDALPSRLAGLIGASVATLARFHRWNLCWGGSTALARPALERMDLPRAWAGTVSDDLMLTRAARAAGCRIHAPLFVLLPGPARFGWRGLLAYGRRQYLILRVHAPRHWWLAMAALVPPVLGAAAALPGALAGESLPLAALGAGLALQQGRASLRLAIARRVLPGEAAALAVRSLRRDRWLLPLAVPLHAGLAIAGGCGRTLRWAGFRYRLRAPDLTEVLERPAPWR